MVSEGRRASLKRWGEIGWCRTRQQILFGPQDAAPPSGVGWGSTEELAYRVVAKRLVLKRIGLPLTLSLKGSWKRAPSPPVVQGPGVTSGFRRTVGAPPRKGRGAIAQGGRLPIVCICMLTFSAAISASPQL